MTYVWLIFRKTRDWYIFWMLSPSTLSTENISVLEEHSSCNVSLSDMNRVSKDINKLFGFSDLFWHRYFLGPWGMKPRWWECAYIYLADWTQKKNQPNSRYLMVRRIDWWLLDSVVIWYMAVYTFDKTQFNTAKLEAGYQNDISCHRGGHF